VVAAHLQVVRDDGPEVVHRHHALLALHQRVGAEDALGVADVGALDVQAAGNGAQGLQRLADGAALRAEVPLGVGAFVMREV
jgi:hypothetical protein